MDVESVMESALKKLNRNSDAEWLRDMEGLATARFFGRGRSAAEPGVARTKVAHGCLANSPKVFEHPGLWGHEPGLKIKTNLLCP